MNLYTKNGRALHVSEGIVYTKSGAVVGRIIEDKVVGPNGKYVGTIAYDRLVYRHNDNSVTGPSFSAQRNARENQGKRRDSKIRGEEPNIPD